MMVKMMTMVDKYNYNGDRDRDHVDVSAAVAGGKYGSVDSICFAGSLLSISPSTGHFADRRLLLCMSYVKNQN
jgi:hypothetical protein